MMAENHEVGLRGVSLMTELCCVLCQEDHQLARVLTCMGAELLDHPVFVGLGVKGNVLR